MKIFASCIGAAWVLSLSACSDEGIPEDGGIREDGGDQDDGGRICTPDSCEGCCDEDRCRLGTDDRACGRQGELCQDCDDLGGSCEEGACFIPECGDGIISEGEDCDGDELGGATCESQGFHQGELSCDDCSFDLSRCALDPCQAAEESGGPCNFCSEDGREEILCGFCRVGSDGIVPDDEYLQCQPSELCLERSCDQGDAVSCEETDVIVCEPGEELYSCDGTISRNCSGCLLDTYDCAEIGEDCMVLTHLDDMSITYAQCVHPGAISCDPNIFGGRCLESENAWLYCSYSWGVTELMQCAEDGICIENGESARCIPMDYIACDIESPPRCAGGDLINCEPILGSDPSFGGYEVPEVCDVGLHCEETAVGGHCVQEGTAACDPDTYEERCDGTRALRCNSWTHWEFYITCSLDELICDLFDGVPSCVPEGYTPCTLGSYDNECDGTIARNCVWPGYVEEHTCEHPNPVCNDEGHNAGCTFEGGGTCDFWADPIAPGFCFDSSTLVYCMVNGLEKARDCSEAENCACDYLVEADEYACIGASSWGMIRCGPSSW